MRKIGLTSILFTLAIFVACAQKTGEDRQMISGGYGLQSDGGSSERGTDGRSIGASRMDDDSQEQEYGGAAGRQTDTRSAHGFDRGSQTQTWGSAERRSGPISGSNSGDMGHGMGTQTSPSSLGGPGVGGPGQ